MASIQYTGNLRSNPRWMGDFGDRTHVLPVPARLDPTQFTTSIGISVTVGADATQSATSITVSALSYGTNAATPIISQGNVLLKAGTVLYFGGAKVATLTADAAYGATSLTVAALPTALTTGDVALYNAFGTVSVPSGTLIGRTYAERDAGTGYGPAAVTDDQIFLTVNDVVDARINPDVELYRHTSVVKENYLPAYTTISTAVNEVQTVAVDTILSGGKIGITAVDSNGVPQTVVVAYNTSWTQTVADIQTALNAQLGTSAVAAAVVSTKNMTLTFSGTNYTGVAQPAVGIDISAATGPTKATVTRTTPGGVPLLTKIRSLYRCVKGQN